MEITRSESLDIRCTFQKIQCMAVDVVYAWVEGIVCVGVCVVSVS